MIGESIIQMKIIINWRKEFISAPKCYFSLEYLSLKKTRNILKIKALSETKEYIYILIITISLLLKKFIWDYVQCKGFNLVYVIQRCIVIH